MQQLRPGTGANVASLHRTKSKTTPCEDAY
jgi:hypothetical protein